MADLLCLAELITSSSVRCSLARKCCAALLGAEHVRKRLLLQCTASVLCVSMVFIARVLIYIYPSDILALLSTPELDIGVVGQHGAHFMVALAGKHGTTMREGG